MELYKNIYFSNDNLMVNSKVKICYTGALIEDNTSDIYLHYGFGSLWENSSESKMIKTDLGYETEIEIKDYDSFNFCFRNSNNKWDNNNYKNYTVTIQNPAKIKSVEDVKVSNIVNQEETISSCSSVSESNKVEASVNNTMVSTKAKTLYPIVVSNNSLAKRIKNLIYKIITYVPKIISGTFTRKKVSKN